MTEELCSKRSEFQKIDVYQTSKLGRMLLLDGIIQLTEFDEFAYHEMLAHIPLFAHENPKRLLVVGGAGSLCHGWSALAVHYFVRLGAV